MKIIGTFLAIAMLFSTSAFAADAASEKANNIIKIIDTQIKAYNSRDIKAFLATYHNDVEIHYFPTGLKYKGIDKLKEEYGPMFDSLTYLNAKVTHRETQGRFAVYTENVTVRYMYEGKEIENTFQAIATYEVEDGLIKRVLFLE